MALRLYAFDLVKKGEAPPEAITVRVCESISCDLAGAEALINSLKEGLGEGVRVQRVPCVGRCQQALGLLDHLVVQDLFVTETAWFADVVLPASAFPEKSGTFTNTDRRVQLGRQALDLPGEARQDLWIIQQLANRLGLPWDYADSSEVYEEMRLGMPSISGISWQRLLREGAVTHPCSSEDEPGA
ncbi:MAG: molybdopterin-dependent oxidoreductase [Sedimenticola sp.]